MSEPATEKAIKGRIKKARHVIKKRKQKQAEVYRIKRAMKRRKEPMVPVHEVW